MRVLFVRKPTHGCRRATSLMSSSSLLAYLGLIRQKYSIGDPACAVGMPLARMLNKSTTGIILQVPFVSGEAISRTPGMKIVHISQGRRHAAVSGSAALVPVFPISVEDITNPPSKVVLKDHDALLFVDEMKRCNM